MKEYRIKIAAHTTPKRIALSLADLIAKRDGLTVTSVKVCETK